MSSHSARTFGDEFARHCGEHKSPADDSVWRNLRAAGEGDPFIGHQDGTLEYKTPKRLGVSLVVSACCSE